MRLGLSIWIVYWHTRGMVGVPWADRTLAIANISHIALPMFFALSGFLVASSLERTKYLPSFLTMRAMRILPALAVEVILSALVLGPIMTTYALSEYFTDGAFYRYFWNIVGYVHYDLPGVFKENHQTRVNGSLWTVPFELECYLALSFIFIVGIYRRTWAVAAFCLLASTWLAWRVGRSFSWETSPLPPGRLLIVYFIAGVLIFKIRDYLPGGITAAAIALAVSLAMVQFDATTWFSPIPMAYATAAIGCTAPPRTPVILDGDYSYGIYLYAYPIQQAWAQLLRSDSLAVNFLLSLATVAFFAAFSWHMIEKPILSKKDVASNAIGRLFRIRFTRSPDARSSPANAQHHRI